MSLFAFCEELFRQRPEDTVFRYSDFHKVVLWDVKTGDSAMINLSRKEGTYYCYRMRAGNQRFEKTGWYANAREEGTVVGGRPLTYTPGVVTAETLRLLRSYDLFPAKGRMYAYYEQSQPLALVYFTPQSEGAPRYGSFALRGKPMPAVLSTPRIDARRFWQLFDSGVIKRESPRIYQDGLWHGRVGSNGKALLVWRRDGEEYIYLSKKLDPQEITPEYIQAHRASLTQITD